MDKGKEKFEIVVNREEAVIVCKIFRMFIQGLTPHTIAIALTAAGIPSPGGCEVWSAATVRRMLSNEKYKGDMLLQKEFTVDFLTKKVKKNEGELPQYYVSNNHEPIIDRGFLILCRKTLRTGKGRINADTAVLVSLVAKLYAPSAVRHLAPDRGIPLPTIIQYGSAVTAIRP